MEKGKVKVKGKGKRKIELGLPRILGRVMGGQAQMTGMIQSSHNKRDHDTRLGNYRTSGPVFGCIKTIH